MQPDGRVLARVVADAVGEAFVDHAVVGPGAGIEMHPVGLGHQHRPQGVLARPVEVTGPLLGADRQEGQRTGALAKPLSA